MIQMSLKQIWFCIYNKLNYYGNPKKEDYYMPRTKGSKNRLKNTDYAKQIEMNKKEKENLVAEIATIIQNIDKLKVNLKEKKILLKNIEKKLQKLEIERLESEKQAAEQKRKEEVESVIKKMYDSGLSTAEILEKLK